MFFNNLETLKAALAENRRRIEWHKKEISYLEAERDQLCFAFEGRKYNKLMEDIRENKKEIESLELNCHGIETELKKYRLAPAAA